ncbi:hypothetical protein [Roseomonas sp. WA12]
MARIRGIRVNACNRSHAELDEAETLDAGDPAILARRYLALTTVSAATRALGSCCGTDHRHVQAICEACTPVPA